MRPPRETCPVRGLFSIEKNISFGSQIGQRKQEDAAFRIVTVDTTASSEAKSFVDMGLHAEPDTAEGNMGAGETILVVEDDGQVHSYVVVLPSSAR